MKEPAAQTVDLATYSRATLPADALSLSDGRRLWERLRPFLELEFPSPRTEGRWGVTSAGWAGVIHLTSRLRIRVLPSVPVANLFRLLLPETALPIRRLDEVQRLGVTSGLAEALALLLLFEAETLLADGLRPAYVPVAPTASTLRGRLDMPRTLPLPPPRLAQRHTTLSVDTPEHRLIARGLLVCRGSSIFPSDQPEWPDRFARAAEAFRHQGVSAPRLRYHRPETTAGTLARLLLESRTPTHRSGSALVPAFLFSMPDLFERYVAGALRRHCPPGWTVSIQETIRLSSSTRFRVDIVLRAPSGAVRTVIDTKYRPDAQLNAGDIAQVVAYAAALEASHAAVVFPVEVDTPGVTVGTVHVHPLGFPLDEDLDAAAKNLVGWLTTF